MSKLMLTAALMTAVSLIGTVAAQDVQAPNPDVFYQLGPDSLEQEGVPKGEIRGPFTLPSAIYPGTQHNYTWGMNRHGQAMGGAILPEMMRWLWRDQPLSTDPRDMVERSPRGPAPRK